MEPQDRVFLMTVFEQSWHYVRHAQSMFWQSFTALFAVITGVLYFTYNKDADGLKLIGYLSATALALVGYLVTLRAMIVLKEHLITINKIRLKCGLEDLDVIPARWQIHDITLFNLRGPETGYMRIAVGIYIAIISTLTSLSIFIMTTFLGQLLSTALSTVAFAAIAYGLLRHGQNTLRPENKRAN